MKRTLINGLIAGLSSSLLVACGGASDSSSADSRMLATTVACYAAWNSTTAYNGGAQVSYNGVNYTAAYWTQGNNPSTNNGPAGSGEPWISNGACGATPTPTPTPAPTPTPTPAPTPTPTPAPTPTPTPAPTPTSTCTLQAEDYANAYDDTAGNAGGAYRTGDVDIEATTDTGGGYNVGWIDSGEWLVHNSVTFPTTGNYTFQYRVSSPNSTGVISSDLNAGSIQLGTTAIPNTGGWQTWTTVQRTVSVNAGTYNVGTYMSTGGFNLNWIKIVGASCSPTPTPAPTPTPTPAPTPAPTPTPTSVVAGYYPSWVASPVRLRNIDSHYNLIYLFAATAPAGNTSGAVTWTPPSDVNGAATNWSADIQYARNTQHRKIILSVGGAGHAMSFPNRTVSTNFVNSIDSLYSQWGGFDGIDWNTFEGQTPDTSEMIWASQELKRRHPGFIVTAPPAPWNTTDQQFCKDMLNAGAIDYCAPQYYDGPNLADPAWALPNIDTWVNLLGANHLVIGFGVDPNTANYWTISSAVSAWKQVKAKYPTIHGAFDWQINNDLLQGYPFAQQLGPLVP